MLRLILIIPFLFSKAEGAPRKCAWNKDGTFFGVGCDTLEIHNSTARAVAALSEVTRTMPSALPTLSTPIGAELNVHTKGHGPENSHSEVTLIKGFNNLGFGLGTWTIGSMGGADTRAVFEGSPFEEAFRKYEFAKPTKQGYRAGSAVEIPTATIVRIRLGGSVGRGQKSVMESVGYGGSIDFARFGFSYSRLRENLSSLIPTVLTTTLSMGYGFGYLYMGISLTSVSITRALANTTLLYFRWTEGRWNVFASHKSYRDFNGKQHLWNSASIHRGMGSHLALGYIYGLYRKSHSVSAQYYF